MNLIGVFQHEERVGLGYFETWLCTRGLPFELIRPDLGESVPTTAQRYAGLCFMGGTMSVNDPLPWIERELELIWDADFRGVPVIGHCLGGQLLAKALGGSVRRNPVTEIGWHRLDVTDPALAAEWLGWTPQTDLGQTFQWHGDTFDLPSRARGFVASAFCANQAFVVERDGYCHIGMQFHCEMTPELVRSWTFDESGAAEIEREHRLGRGAGVQSTAEILRDLEVRTRRLNLTAAAVYERWSVGLRGLQGNRAAAAICSAAA